MINKVILVGNVGADPEIRALESGVKVARIRLATTERVPNKDKSGYTDITVWHSITLWRNLADVADKWVRKGSQLYIEGKLRPQEYEKNGVKCFATEIVADEIRLLGKRDYQSSVSQEPQRIHQNSASDYPTPSIPTRHPDDLPF